MKDLLIVEHISKQFSERQVFDDIDFTVSKGEFVTVIGKSGTGKSTLLRLLSGLDKPDSGQILHDGKQVNQVNPEARMMFQDGRLLPWKTVLNNLLIGNYKGKKAEAIKLLGQVGLSEYTDYYPHQLSGGQKQRVAFARALLHQPSLLLLDEPLGALDAFTRQEMQKLLASLCKKQQMTALLVTHDIEEAIYLSDRILILDSGQVLSEIVVDLPFPRHKEEEYFRSIKDEVSAYFSLAES
ncbi:MAG: ABC transporter ATP-binding protein [Streptococcaceae bacterium]|nr:ABC transporter ATP-binding protein [Streptococcaceae bacterium]MCH4177103.1 ABC transporter ATP-binding protein [Streptococcaceae bacterium]